MSFAIKQDTEEGDWHSNDLGNHMLSSDSGFMNNNLVNLSSVGSIDHQRASGSIDYHGRNISKDYNESGMGSIVAGPGGAGNTQSLLGSLLEVPE